jgi:flagellar basal-body rod modification protein FlgD
MSIASVSNQQSSANSSSSSDSSAKSLSNNYTMFLQLLTTQLQNQSPLDPMDADQFTSQLVQYSSVEQLIKMNTNLSDVKSSLEASNLASLVNYVGTNVTVDASTKTMANGEVSWNIDAAKSASNATITVKDSAGNTVFTKKTTLEAGDNAFTWDGKGTDGQTYTSGSYTVSVSARTASGTSVKASTDITGKVDSLEWTDGTPYLVIGGTRYLTSSVTKISSVN